MQMPALMFPHMLCHPGVSVHLQSPLQWWKLIPGCENPNWTARNPPESWDTSPGRQTAPTQHIQMNRWRWPRTRSASPIGSGGSERQTTSQMNAYRHHALRSYQNPSSSLFVLHTITHFNVVHLIPLQSSRNYLHKRNCLSNEIECTTTSLSWRHCHHFDFLSSSVCIGVHISLNLFHSSSFFL